jgi:hypothetical protein
MLHGVRLPGVMTTARLCTMFAHSNSFIALDFSQQLNASFALHYDGAPEPMYDGL